jgi:hypothetical protein
MRAKETRTALLPMLPMLGLAALLGPGAYALGQAVDRGEHAIAAFSLLLLPCGTLLTFLANAVEAAVFSIMKRPWLGGRLKWWQQLILPYKTALYLPLGFAAVTTSGIYLIAAEPAAATGLVLSINALGGALTGFALARLGVGIVIVRTSGLWRASQRAWLLGALVIAVISMAFAARSVSSVLDASTVV